MSKKLHPSVKSRLVNSNPRRVNLVFEGYLVLAPHGTRGPAVKAFKHSPPLKPGERSMRFKIEVPETLFQTPTLRLNVDIDEDAVTPDPIEIQAKASRALSDAGIQATVVLGDTNGE